MKTKTAVNGLASLVLAAGLTSCGHSCTPPAYAGNQQEPEYACKDMSENRPPKAVDKSALEVCTLIVYDSVHGLPCTRTALVSLYNEGYSIRCDTDHRFQRYPNTDVLVWNSTKFYDENRDGVADYIEDYVTRKAGEEDVKLYKRLLGILEKDFVHSLWQERWHPNDK